MCIVSDKIKFCTCVSGDVEKLKHYWKLYRFDKNKNLMCVGEPMFPTYMIDCNFKINETVLLARINEVDAFDIPLALKPKDILEVVINNHNHKGLDRFTYTFKFVKNKWKPTESDVFELLNNYDEKQSGKIKSALERKI